MTRAFDAKIRAVIGTQGGPTRAFEGLRIAFRAEKDDAPDAPNKCSVKIYNLSQSSRAITRTEDSLLQIYAGYGDALHLAFLGAITRSTTDDNGIDSITTVESAKPTTGRGVLSSSFKGQQNLTDMLAKAAAPLEALGVDLGAVPDTKIRAPRGVVLSGPPGQVLNRLTAANNLDWFVEDGVVKVVPRGASTQERAFVLSPRSGLVGSPRPLKPSGQSGSSQRLAVEVVSRLNPRLRLRRIIQVSGTDELAGWYQIRKVIHEGDLWAQQWTTTVEATPVRAQEAP